MRNRSKLIITLGLLVLFIFSILPLQVLAVSVPVGQFTPLSEEVYNMLKGGYITSPQGLRVIP
ncbi:hypothetical protein SAMN02745221_01989 [Thermosyntropha lipolytica DSM 11003]|uniref:Uncharacterized protein n=2 Tax=Thermosyntropha TaxID=54293 RepID=A0A1M5RB93_9FIRM|nr:hypothetical protein SAMN02745221_01989 [Thermosyntropha lipolytica DSM 11003]